MRIATISVMQRDIASQREIVAFECPTELDAKLLANSLNRINADVAKLMGDVVKYIYGVR